MFKTVKSWFSGTDARVEALNAGGFGAEQGPPSDTRSSIRIGAVMLLLGFGGFLFWAVTAPLDEGVPTQGVVSVESKRKTVQHLSGGIVRELLVREAQTVKAGDPLVVLDDTTVRSSYEAAVQTMHALRAHEARLLAEQGGAREVVFPQSLMAPPQHPLAIEHMAVQRQVFQARRLALESELAVMAESAATYDLQAQGLEAQVEFLRQELAGIRQLASEGYAPRNRHFEVERQFAELQNNALRARRSASEMRLRAAQRRQEFRREVETQLAEVKREAANAEERARALKEDLERTVIRSPADGFVTGLAVHTVGGVVTPGSRLMDVVPANDALIFETRVPSHLIDRAHAGLLADISLHSFANRPDLVVEGKVVSVSADLITDPNPNLPPYYLARVEVTPDGARKLGGLQLQPGMPADVVIKTGERTLMTYLLKPLLRRLAQAMTEA